MIEATSHINAKTLVEKEIVARIKRPRAFEFWAHTCPLQVLLHCQKRF
jgi:hypothetical protein